MSWPWQTKTLLELVRDAGLLPEVNIISGVQNYIIFTSSTCFILFSGHLQTIFKN